MIIYLYLSILFHLLVFRVRSSDPTKDSVHVLLFGLDDTLDIGERECDRVASHTILC